MELTNKFMQGQFVQEISFKHNGLPRHDLGIERFGFIKMHWIIARTYHEYEVVFGNYKTNENVPNTLEYCLRSLTESEIAANLNYISQHQMEFADFIIALNDTPNMASYHIAECDELISYRSSLSNLELMVSSHDLLELSEHDSKPVNKQNISVTTI